MLQVLWETQGRAGGRGCRVIVDPYLVLGLVGICVGLVGITREVVLATLRRKAALQPEPDERLHLRDPRPYWLCNICQHARPAYALGRWAHHCPTWGFRLFTWPDRIEARFGRPPT